MYKICFTINLFHVSSTMCSSSGGQNCIIQHLVSSHSVSGRPVHRLTMHGTLRLFARVPFPSNIYFLLSSFIHPLFLAALIYFYFFFFILRTDALKHSKRFFSFVTGMMNKMLAPLAQKLKTM